MQNLPTGGDLAGSDERTQCLILNLITSEEQRPWSVEEIVRVLGDVTTKLAVEDALSELRTAGLVNRADSIYFASRAAAHIGHLGMPML